MSRWKFLDSVPVPGDQGELRLYQRDKEYAIRVPGQGELMNSRAHGSEDALGNLSCAGLECQPTARVLVGGLGMGFTLRAALDTLGPSAKVVVAELVPEVVAWNEGPLGECADHPLQDPRVEVRVADVGHIIRESEAIFDAIMLDVDNGPEGMTRRTNDRLYSLAGLSDTYLALRPEGNLAVWSASPDRGFSGDLGKTGFDVTEHRVRAHAGKGARHIVWVARRPGPR